MLKKFTSRSGTMINFNGDSRLVRSDGSVSIVPKEYWVERSQISNSSQIYNDLGKITDLTIIKALDDEVLVLDAIQKESNAKIVNLKGDHNFNGDSRTSLLAAVDEIL